MAQMAPAMGDDDIPTSTHPCKTDLTKVHVLLSLISFKS
jgi:hypothetical protein